MKWSIKEALLTSALFITICAGLFSVTGIAKLFAGAYWSALAMATALEVGKVISISFLYRYWSDISRWLKGYLLIASMVLMLITSAGIYGYLSAAYAAVAADPLARATQVSILESQKATMTDQIRETQTRITQLATLREQQERRLDTLIAKSSTGTGSSIRVLQTQLAQQDREVAQLRTQLGGLTSKYDSLSAQAMTEQLAITTDSKIGTFVYIGRMLGVELDTVVKWFILTLVLVFDPLAVALILAYNHLVRNNNHLSSNKEINVPHSDPPADQPPPPPPATSPGDGPAPRRDPQYFARDGFDWGNRAAWESDPNAVRYYERHIKNR